MLTPAQEVRLAAVHHDPVVAALREAERLICERYLPAATVRRHRSESADCPFFDGAPCDDPTHWEDAPTASAYLPEMEPVYAALVRQHTRGRRRSA